jgi:hypothetical protein
LKGGEFIRTVSDGKPNQTACATGIVVIKTEQYFDGKRVLTARIAAAMTAGNRDVIVARRQRFRPRFVDFRFFYNEDIVLPRRR